MVWESHQFQWALKTELLVAFPPPCFPSPPTAPFPEPFARPPLDTRADSFPPGNDACEPSRTRFPTLNKHYPLFIPDTPLFDSRLSKLRATNLEIGFWDLFTNLSLFIL